MYAKAGPRYNNIIGPSALDALPSGSLIESGRPPNVHCWVDNEGKRAVMAACSRIRDVWMIATS